MKKWLNASESHGTDPVENLGKEGFSADRKERQSVIRLPSETEACAGSGTASRNK